jgi:lysophospholipase L1-like esterase
MTTPLRTVLCYGDSNTHGSLPMETLDDLRRLGPAERWPGVMAAILGPSWRVVEEGLPGRTTVHPDPIEGEHKNGLAALPVALESHVPIDLVVLMLGTNDFKTRFSLVGEDIAASIDRLVATILASQAGPARAAPEVLVVAPPPVLERGCLGPMYTGGEAKSARLGELYGATARRRGLAFLDAGAFIRSSELDGIHFDAAEHDKLGKAVAAAVSALFGGA